jgi:hypothetical protein
MDELTLLRELEAGTPPLRPEARYRARMRLRYEIAYERRPPRTPRLGPLVAAAAAAAVMAVTLVVLDRERAAPPEPRVQLTAAAEALHLAAIAAGAKATGPIPRDDQYLYRKEVTEERPLDGTGRTRTYVDENWVSVDGSRPTRNSELGKVWTTTGGGWPTMRFEDLRRLPTDPGQLLLHIRDWPSDGRDRSEPMTPDDYESAYMYLSMLLFHQPPMPPALRAAAFDALARIPGVAIVDDEVDARGRRGVAISRPPLGGQAIILDAATHEYLGFSNTDLRDGERVVRVSSRVATGVVDEIGERP